MDDSEDNHFDPVLCAQLHNDLISKAASVNQELAPLLRQNALSMYNIDLRHPLDPDTPIEEYLSEPLLVFLSEINSYLPSFSESLMFPFFEPPQPIMFWGHPGEVNLMEEHEWLILLYPDDYHKILGGLFFDQEAGLATFIRPPHVGPKDDLPWMPLDVILRKWLKMWETGKVAAGIIDPNGTKDDHLGLVGWTAWEQQDALKAWDALVAAVVGRMPAGSIRQDSVPRAMLSASSLDRCGVHSRVMHGFLANARVPQLTSGKRLRVAPGIVHPTDATYDPRSDAGLYPAGLYPAGRSHVLLPAAAHQREIDPSEISPRSEDDNAGALHTAPGIHLLCNDMYPDAVAYISESTCTIDARGNTAHTTAAQKPLTDFFKPARKPGSICPWNPARVLCLADVLRLWTSMVESGRWSVNGDGVAGDLVELERAGRDEARLRWEDVDI